MKITSSIILIAFLSVFSLASFAQLTEKDSILKKENPNEYIRQLEAMNKELDSLVNLLSGEVLDDTLLYDEELENDSDVIDINENRRPSSQQPQCILSYFIPENNFFYYNTENQIQVVANGYYDTYVESSQAAVIPNENNALFYTIIPTNKKSCKLSVFGVTENGTKIQLGIYEFGVKEKNK